jgi:hypothetical protein
VDTLRKLKAVNAGHHNIRQHRIDPVVHDEPKGILCIGDGHRPIAKALDQNDRRLSNKVVVIYH